jgi:hypothetical protein
MRRHLFFWMVGFGALWQSGCASSCSTLLLRDDCNTVWTKTRSRGTPITLKVPTHVKLYVYEKHFIEKIHVGDVIKMQYMKMPVVIRDFAQDFIYTEKIVMVDFKRPAAGSFNLDVELTDDQYIKRIQHNVTDETIARVTELVGKIAPSGLFKPTSGGSFENNLMEVKSVVAVGVFEVDSPEFERSVSAFVDCHFNRAHDAWMVPPGVEGFQRKPLTEEQAIPGPELCSGIGSCVISQHTNSSFPQDPSVYSQPYPDEIIHVDPK